MSKSITIHRRIFKCGSRILDRYRNLIDYNWWLTTFVFSCSICKYFSSCQWIFKACSCRLKSNVHIVVSNEWKNETLKWKIVCQAHISIKSTSWHTSVYVHFCYKELTWKYHLWSLCYCRQTHNCPTINVKNRP